MLLFPSLFFLLFSVKIVGFYRRHGKLWLGFLSNEAKIVVIIDVKQSNKKEICLPRN